jgi:hypothetical protein
MKSRKKKPLKVARRRKIPHDRDWLARKKNFKFGKGVFLP